MLQEYSEKAMRNADPSDELLTEFADVSANIEAEKLYSKYKDEPSFFRKVLIRLNKKILGDRE